MKLTEFFYPYRSYADGSLSGAAPVAGVMRTVAGISLDDKTGSLFLIDPHPSEGAGLYECKPAEQFARLLDIPNNDEWLLYGIATEVGSDIVWISDRRSCCIFRIDRNGCVLACLDPGVTGIRHPGLITLGDGGSSLFVTDLKENSVTHMGVDGKVIFRFGLTPYAGARLRGITRNPGSETLYLSYMPEIPEQGGRLGEHYIYEVTNKGKIFNRYDTAALGFCALDIAMGPQDNILYAVSREYVLPQTIGDHCHIFVLDLNQGESPQLGSPNKFIVSYFLKYNTLLDGSSNIDHRHRVLCWKSMPVSVYISELLDMSYADVQSIFLEWSACTKGGLEFSFVDKAPETGIIFIQGDISMTCGRPGAQGVVTVCVSDRNHLPSHPREMGRHTVQRNVARHEIGHALGFVGHSPRFRIDTMNSISGYTEKISPEEAAFIEILYDGGPLDLSFQEIENRI